MNPAMNSTLLVATSSNKSLRFSHFLQSFLILSNPFSSLSLSASMTSCATLLSLAEDKEEEEDEEWMVSMLISPSFCFGDSNFRVENEERASVPKEGLGRERSEVVETWERVEGRDPYGSSMERQ